MKIYGNQFDVTVSCNGSFLYKVDGPSEDGLLKKTETCKGVYKQ
jgi:hypothetical protein